MVKCNVNFTTVLLFVTIIINIIINIRYRCLFSGRKSTASNYLLCILLFFYTQKQKRVILYYAGSLYQWILLSAEFERHCTGISVSAVQGFIRCGAVQGFSNGRQILVVSALVDNFLAFSHPIFSHISNIITKLKHVKYCASLSKRNFFLSLKSPI